MTSVTGKEEDWIISFILFLLSQIVFRLCALGDDDGEEIEEPSFI
jgi:hypothetical protein